jgi:starvation-inducible DNA-binding protein
LVATTLSSFTIRIRGGVFRALGAAGGRHNAYLARGGRAVARRTGTAYVDVGTVQGYRRAVTLLGQPTTPATPQPDGRHGARLITQAPPAGPGLHDREQPNHDAGRMKASGASVRRGARFAPTFHGIATPVSTEGADMAPAIVDADKILQHAAPITDQHAHEIQPWGHVIRMPIALAESACRESVEHLNQLLADTMTLRDLYKKHHRQVAGPTFYQLHLLFDKHYAEQAKLIDDIAERIQLLGGVSVAMAQDVAEMTLIPRPPRGREPVPVQISRLLHAHEIVLKETRTMARLAAERDDQGTNDLLVSSVIRVNELQAWFVSEHVVDTPVIRAE